MYAAPAFAAVFALMLVVATPHVQASPDGEKAWKSGKHHMRHTIQVDGFVGSIPITEDADKAALKEKVTVSLSEAAQGLDVQGGHIGVVTNENGDKFLAWNLVSVDKESEKMTATIHIVDARDAENTAQVTKEFGHPWKMQYSTSDAE
ncbi:MAG: hypothetical protein CV087_20305 [Candidatus Brocadia sp. WS118]|nr:MAG: hypothetical protein CV087_20305 [Candidatus Brocadia sp. WS118]